MTKIYGYDTNIYETTIGNISNYCQEIKGTQYYTEEYVKILQQKVEQLNNIINELEEYCWELKAMGCREGALDMLDKLKALKENNK